MRKEELKEVTKLLKALRGEIKKGTIRFLSLKKVEEIGVETRDRLNYGKPVLKKRNKVNNLSIFLSDVEDLSNNEDFFSDEAELYFTPNIFTVKGQKKSGNVAYLSTLFADLDDCTVDEAMKRLKASPLPQPSYALFTGHGVHFYWILSYKLPVNEADKNGYHYEKSWLKVQNFISDELQSDKKVNEISKFLRIPLSINNKGIPIKSKIIIDNLDKKYDFREDFYNKFCRSSVSFDPNKYKSVSKKKQKKMNVTNAVVDYPVLFDEDIKTLLKIRKKNNFKWEGLRTYTLLIFKCNNKPESYIRYINDEVFDTPLPESELKNILKYENEKKGITRKKVLDWLKITDEETRFMKVLISEDEVKYRETIKKTRNEFNKLAKEYMNYLKFNYVRSSKYKGNKKVGRELGYNETTISKYRRKTFNIKERNRLVKRMLIEYEKFCSFKKDIEESDTIYSNETLDRLEEANKKITNIKAIMEDRNELTSKNKFKVTVLLGKYKELTRMK